MTAGPFTNPGSHEMNILYFPVHEVLEFDDLRLLTGLGHAVFSTGAYGSPRPETVLRSARAEFFSPQHHAAYEGARIPLPMAS